MASISPSPNTSSYTETMVESVHLPSDQRSIRPMVASDKSSHSDDLKCSRISKPKLADEQLEKICSAIRTLLECVGENPDREGLINTPARYAKALLFLTKGYEADVESLVNNALFHE